jgi:hydrogenase maturation protein HypF
MLRDRMTTLSRARVAVQVSGVVQGVGFRPFVYGRAAALGLGGWVRNTGFGVEVEVEGGEGEIEAFLSALRSDGPRAARVDSLGVRGRAPLGDRRFRIVDSAAAGAAEAGDSPRTLPAPDAATCPDCAAEVAAPGSRRARYPFTACARCGPRHSIIEALPYDRARTTLRAFPMCARCAAEHGDPSDRRFHAEAIACPACGPSLALYAQGSTSADTSRAEAVVARGDAALVGAGRALRDGRIVAVKGLGGYQLLVDAGNEESVARLRGRKRREEKPFAMLVADLRAARRLCLLSDEEAALLASPAAPIVLLDRCAPSAVPIAASVAPGLGRLGVMLPTTPLHMLIAAEVAGPLVCTSGNVADEPICTNEDEAFARLAPVADLFLAHDRAIVRPVDDSVVQVGARGPEILRRARGYAPLSVAVPKGGRRALAFGGHQKVTVTWLGGERAIVSEHIGDLGSPASIARLERAAADLIAFAGAEPEVVACDAHPDFGSSRIAARWAAVRGAPLVPVQHHHAHAAACAAEHGVIGPATALCWDGAGLGEDATLWGGEALVVDGPRFRRAAHLRTFPLPGGVRAMRDPVAALVGLAVEAFGGAAAGWLAGLGISGARVARTVEIATRPSISPRTSSVGRLFDGVAALLDVRRRAGYEGAAAVELEATAGAAAAAGGADVEGGCYPLPLAGGVFDFAPLLLALAADRAAGVPAAVCAARFHETLAALAVALARLPGLPRVLFGGGCFQNRLLAFRARARLEAAGFEVFAPQRLPANDGGLSLGQAVVAAWRT